MSSIAVWNIQSGKPVRLNRGPVSLEKDLENWIERDPGLINPDLLIVGRQLHVEAGILDLLALDRLGNYWAVIEIKRGNVRRETVTQAIDYAACIYEMSDRDLSACMETYLKSKNVQLNRFLKANDLDKTVFDHDRREVEVYVVGTGRDLNLERMADYLKKRGFLINVVTFDTYEDGSNNWTLVRELEELDGGTPPPPTEPTDSSIAKLIAKAYKNGIGEAFELIYNAATKHGLFPRVFSQSIMYAPITDRRRFLIYTPIVRKDGKYIFYYKPEAFAEFFPVGTLKALSILGIGGVQSMTAENARKFIRKLDRLFEVIKANS